MKLKRTLWALAFACIAMSCSDDELTGPGSENEGGSGSATTAQMKVIISAGTGTSTKANDAEQGDGNELGSLDEYQVKDIAVFLYSTSTPTGSITLTGSEVISAMGYVENPTNQSTSNPTYHQWEATIKVTLTDTDLQNFADKNFGVIALTNITQDSYDAIKEVVSNPTTNTVQHLADYLQSGIHTNQGFVMSTHMMDDTGADYGPGSNYSVVSFPSSTAATAEIPEVECYVERLAAKVRINSGTNGYTYNVTNYAVDPAVQTEDKVTLQYAVVINQLCSGEYLLKRVSSATHTDLDLSGTVGFTLLGDEQYTAASGSNPATGNFVGDPWIIRKTTTNASSSSTDNNKVVSFSSITAEGKVQTSASNKALSYNNHIAMTDGAADPKTLNYGAFWDNLSELNTSDSWEQQQVQYKSLTDTDPITLAYTMENTVNVANSVNAFMTGVMFQAKYVPAKVSDIDSDNQSIKDDATLPTDGTFYTRGNTKFASLDAIFAYELATNGTGGSPLLYWDSFMPTAWSNLKAKDLKAFLDVNTMMDSFGYLKYLTDNWSSIVSSITDATTMSELTGIYSFNDYIDPSKNATFSLPTNIKKYDKGTCYYFYWIRHEDNGDPLTVGPMEYAIVRNNIYDLTVSGISGLGEAAIDVPDPSEPAETKTATIQVTLKVRNWVVRKNDNIIL